MLLLSDKTKSNTFLFGITLLFVGLTLSKAITSLVTIYFLVLFLIQKDYKYPFALLKKNKSLRIFLLLVTWMIISLMWSDDKKAGIQSFGANLNFFIWPILMILFSEKVNRFKNIILLIFTLIVSTVSLIQFVNFQYLHGFHDIREMALHVSHIRFAIMIVISIFIGVYFLLIEQRNFYKFCLILLICWLLFYSYYSQVLSGLLGMIGGLFGLIIYLIINKSNIWVKCILLVLVVFFTIFCVWLTNDITSEKYILQPKKLASHTKLGNEYENNLHSKIIENGYFLDLYYCEKEVDSSWRLRSNKSLEDLSPRGYKYKYILKRYLTSKGLRKDALGVKTLSNQDIKNIENGITTVVELENGLLARYHQLKFEFSGDLDPNGHSILQRLEFWKASKYIIKEHWLFGVGLGNSKNAFTETYKKINSKLLPENQLESHNQFLNVWISYGVIGLILFILWLFYIMNDILTKSWLYMTVFFVLIFSFLVEDTLTTLVGMTLFAFFTGVFQNQLMLEQD
jgi:O-antigen ligase